MNSEKKKRVPKPQITHSIQRVISVIPWLNYKPKVWSEDEFLNLFKMHVIPGFFPMLNDKDSIESIAVSMKNVEAITILKNTLSLARAMIHDLANVAEKEFEWTDEANRIVSEMKTVFLLNPPRIEQEVNLDIPESRKLFYIPKKFSQMMVKAIIEAFGAFGKAYIGSCPKCKKIFAKGQLNKVFCSNLCASADGKMREYYKKRD